MLNNKVESIRSPRAQPRNSSDYSERPLRGKSSATIHIACGDPYKNKGNFNDTDKTKTKKSTHKAKKTIR